MATVVGVPKEIKDLEGRVSMQPDGVAELVHHGHEVLVQSGAGRGAGFADEEYEAAGARLVDGPDEVFEAADLIVKVKEPVPEEYDRFRDRKSTRLNSSHANISYAVFCLKKKN